MDRWIDGWSLLVLWCLVALFLSFLSGPWLHDTALYNWENVQVWRIEALQVTDYKFVALFFGVQVSFNFVQVWAGAGLRHGANVAEARGE